MTVTEQTPEISYTADGIEDTFVYNYLIQAATDIAVYENDILTALAYTVTGVGVPAGGNVIFSSTVPGSGVVVTLKREVAYSQEVDLISYGNPPITVYEDAIDKMVMQTQQLEAIFDRCIRIPASLRAVIDTRLVIPPSPTPDPSDTVIGYNSVGDPVLLPIAAVGQIVSQPVTIAFSVTKSAHKVLSAASAFVDVEFNTKLYDLGSDFNISTYTFTASVSGYYQMNVTVRIDKMRTESNISWYAIYLVTTGGTYSATFDVSLLTSLPDYAFGYTFNINKAVYVAAADTVKIQTRQEGGSIVDTNVRTESWFDGFLLAW